MLDQVKAIGDFTVKRKGLESQDILTEQPLNTRVIKENKAKVICIDFDLENEKPHYKGVHVEDYEISKLDKYLYRDHPSQRFRITPTDKISSLNKSSWRVAYWFRKYDQYKSNSLVQNLEKELVKEKEIKTSILNDIQEEFRILEADSKKNCLLTFTFQRNGEQKYLGDFPIFNDILNEEGMKEFWAPGVSLHEGTCYLCGTKGKVSRPREPFSFYTINPKGFSANLNSEEAWKQLPICSDCVLKLAEGRNFMDKYLSKRFYGYQFYVIPTFVFTSVQKTIMEDVISLKQDEKYQNSFLSEEDDISHYFKDKRGVFGK